MNFAMQLTEELERDGRSRAEQAEAFGISRSNLSQFCSGAVRCGENQLQRILDKVGEDARDRLAAAWVRDRIPKIVPAGRISVELNTSRVNEPGEPWPVVDRELEAAAKRLLHRATRFPEIRTALLSFESALRGK